MPPAPKAEKPVEPKPKRTLSEDQLAKLKIAREKALVVKKAMREKSDDKKVQHYQEKIMKIKGKKPDELPIEEEVQNLEIDEQEESQAVVDQFFNDANNAFGDSKRVVKQQKKLETVFQDRMKSADNVDLNNW